MRSQAVHPVRLQNFTHGLRARARTSLSGFTGYSRRIHNLAFLSKFFRLPMSGVGSFTHSHAPGNRCGVTTPSVLSPAYSRSVDRRIPHVSVLPCCHPIQCVRGIGWVYARLDGVWMVRNACGLEGPAPAARQTATAGWGGNYNGRWVTVRLSSLMMVGAVQPCGCCLRGMLGKAEAPRLIGALGARSAGCIVRRFGSNAAARSL